MKYLVVLLLAGLSLSALANEPTLVYLVRHAEKVDESKDPDLSEPGFRRAEALKRFFGKIPVDTIIATQYQRTRKTVEPTAKAQAKEVRIIEAGKEEKVVEEIRAAEGGIFLVSGHSNTIPRLIKLLGGPETTINHDAYSNVFLIIAGPNGVVFQNFQIDP